jgi:hypothetical protein
MRDMKGGWLFRYMHVNGSLTYSDLIELGETISIFASQSIEELRKNLNKKIN